jgi:hypothetical protein
VTFGICHPVIDFGIHFIQTSLPCVQDHPEVSPSQNPWKLLFLRLDAFDHVTTLNHTNHESGVAALPLLLVLDCTHFVSICLITEYSVRTEVLHVLRQVVVVVVVVAGRSRGLLLFWCGPLLGRGGLAIAVLALAGCSR